MAEIQIDGDVVHVVFSPIERLGALRRNLAFPVHQVRGVRVVENPFEAVRGLRAPGTAWPRRIALGTWRSHDHGNSVVAAYRGRPALVIDVDGERFDRVVVSTDSAAELQAALSARA
jgi:hypothetical protein